MASGHANTHNPMEGGVWNWRQCLEIKGGGWYQPFMMNRAALLRLRSSAASYGIMQTCKAFRVTHDVGMGPFVWSMGLNHIYIPGLQKGNLDNVGVRSFKPVRLAVHCLKPFDDEDWCHEEARWPHDSRYNQSIVLGCGSVSKRGPFHDTDKNNKHADAFDMFEYFRDHGENVTIGVLGKEHWVRAIVTLYNSPNELRTDSETNITTAVSEVRPLQVKEILSSEGFSPDPEEAFRQNPSKIRFLNEKYNAAQSLYDGQRVYQIAIPRIVHLYGYNETQHAKRFDIVKQFEVFSPADCLPPGEFKNLR